MTRPCFIVIDHEFPDSISTRKLVLETAKYNVITAYTGREAVETLRLFSNVSGVVMNEAVTGMDCDSLVEELRAIREDMLLIVTSSRGMTDCVVACPTHPVSRSNSVFSGGGMRRTSWP
jgi:response regulator RpfG family c-di-GMP phosphodiesterase